MTVQHYYNNTLPLLKHQYNIVQNLYHNMAPSHSIRHNRHSCAAQLCHSTTSQLQHGKNVKNYIMTTTVTNHCDILTVHLNYNMVNTTSWQPLWYTHSTTSPLQHGQNYNMQAVQVQQLYYNVAQTLQARLHSHSTRSFVQHDQNYIMSDMTRSVTYSQNNISTTTWSKLHHDKHSNKATVQHLKYNMANTTSWQPL